MLVVTLEALVGLAAAYLAACGALLARLTATGARRPFQRQPSDVGLAFDAVNFPSREASLLLNGWLIRPRGEVSGRSPVVMVHGWKRHRENEAAGRTLDIARDLVNLGHSVLMFDLRGYGLSQGHRFTLGFQEAKDVAGAVDFLETRGLAAGGVNVLGFSMGAASAVFLAASDSRVCAVAADSCYARLGQVIGSRAAKVSRFPGFFVPGLIVLAPVVLGARVSSVRPDRAVRKLSDRGVPLLVIHGRADDVIPFDNGLRLAQAYGPGVKTLFVEKAHHVGSYAAGPAQYITALESLFR